MTVKTRTNDGKIPVGVRFTEDEYKNLQQIAFEKNRTVNTLIISTMRELLQVWQEEMLWLKEEHELSQRKDGRTCPAAAYFTDEEYKTLHKLACKLDLTTNEYLYFLFKKEEAALSLLSQMDQSNGK